MFPKKNHYVLLFCALFLQSCSGGQIGSFLESSFNNKDEMNTNNSDINLLSPNLKGNNPKMTRSTKQNTNRENSFKTNTNTSKDIKKEMESKVNNKILKFNKAESNPKSFEGKKSISNKKNNSNKKFLNKKSKYNPKSYRIIVILNDVDPSSPSEEFSRVLKNSNIDFQIEKIERFPDENLSNEKD